MSDISVVIPHYNNGHEIYRAYNSVLAQSLLPREIIIVDDCSSDKRILLEIEKNHELLDVELIILYLDKNSGPSAARNVGVNYAKSKYIAFLDSDDAWSVDKLKVQYKIMEENNLSFSFHLYSAFPINIDVSDHALKKINLLKLAKKQIICTPTVMVKKSTLCGFDENIKYCEDFLCWVKSNNNNYFYLIESVLAYGFKRQYGDSGLSSNLSSMHLGALEVFKILYSEKYITYLELCIFCLFEYVKYPFRILRSKFF